MISIDRERFLSIVNANKKREAEVNFKGEICSFYEQIGLAFGSQIADIIQGVNFLFKKKGFNVIELPLKDKEISAFYFDGNNYKKYIIMNSSLSIVNNNFAILHEAYHVLFRKKAYMEEAETYLLTYDLNEEESCANTFAGVILLPEDTFTKIFNIIRDLYEDINVLSKNDRYCYVLTQLMAYFKATYMSVLIRCFELDLISISDDVELDRLLEWGTEDNIRRMCKVMLLNDTFMDSTKKNDYLHFFESIDQQLTEAKNCDLASSEEIDILKQKIASFYNKLVEVEE